MVNRYGTYEISESTKLQASFAPSDAFDDRMFFVSLNEDVATVDMNSGEVKAIKDGEATVCCVAASGVYSDCHITVGSSGSLPVIEKIKNNPVIVTVSSGVAAVVAFIICLLSRVAGWFKK